MIQASYAAHAQNSEVPAPSQKSVDILIVDDREDNLLTLAAVLKGPDYRLVTAQSGEEALRYLLNDVPAVILMDVQMPGLDGYETADLIKGNPRTRDIPIIFITALHKDERFLRRGYKSGAVDYIYKPYDAEILRSKVSVFAELYRKNLQLLEVERKLREEDAKDRERKLADLEIRSLRREQSDQKRYRELVEGIHHGIVWSATPDMAGFFFIGPNVERFLGYPAAQWLEEPNFWLNHLHAEDHAAFERALANLRSEDDHVEVEHRNLSASGETVWFQTTMRLSTSASGERQELRGLSIDITRLKLAEATLQRGKERADLLAKASLLLSRTLESSAKIPEVAELGVQSLADWFAVDLLAERNTVKNLTTAVKRGAASAGDIISDSANWSLSDAEGDRAYLIPVTDEGTLRLEAGSDKRFQAWKELGIHSIVIVGLFSRSRLIGRLVMARGEAAAFDNVDLALAEDLGYRISVALESTALYRELEAAVKIRDEFLSIASHELKTPLTPLKMQTQQLGRMLTKEHANGIPVERVAKMIQISNRQIERLSKLIEDLLDIARISQGKLSLNLEEFDLAETIRDVLSRFTDQLKSGNCEMIVDIPEALPVSWDLFRTEQVITNLLTNALRYAAGKPIEITAKLVDEHVELTFRDEGIGIALEDQARIFQRFERAVSGNHFGGLGLGLYIVSQILEAHGGKIRVESAPGRGAKFQLRLPKCVKQESKPDSAA